MTGQGRNNSNIDSQSRGLSWQPVSPVSLTRLVARGSAGIAETFQARAWQSPEQVFLKFEGGEWRYGEAFSLCRALAARLFDLPGWEGGRVATYLENCPEAVWTILSTALAGGVLVPLNRKHRGQMIVDMLVRSGARILVTDASGRDLEILLRAVDSVASVIVVSDSERAGERIIPFSRLQLGAVDGEPPAVEHGAGSELAMVMYTSGSTGRAKAVAIPGNMLIRGSARVVDALAITERDIFHAWLPLYHIFGQLHILMASIVAGSTVALFRRFSASRFIDETIAVKATLFGGLSTAFRHILSQAPRPEDTMHGLRLGLGGEITSDMHAEFDRRFGVRLIDSYGMTEAEPITLPNPESPSPPGSCGIAAPDFEVGVFANDGGYCTSGIEGTIRVRPRAPNVMFLGYEGDADCTLAALRDLWFDTGDLGHLDQQGFLFVTGRRGNLVRRKGENVSLIELEDLIRQAPGVSDVACFPATRTSADVEILALVEQAVSSSLSPAGLAEWCLSELADFMQPRYVGIVPDFSRSELGKVLRGELHSRSQTVWDAIDGTYRPIEEVTE